MSYNYELLADYACIFYSQLWPAFFFFLPRCSPFVQSHILWKLSELMGFEQWERLWGFVVCFFFFKSVQWRMHVTGRIERELRRQDVSVIHSDSHVMFLMTVLSRAWHLKEEH